MHDNDFVDEDDEENLDGLDTSSENEGNSAALEHLFKKEEIAVFRGTDGLSFNLLKITKDCQYNMTPQTKIVGNFLVESETLENGTAVFKETDQWRRASITFAHILQDNDENIVTVNLTERETSTGRIYLMDTETYEELKTVSEDFEESL